MFQFLDIEREEKRSLKKNKKRENNRLPTLKPPRKMNLVLLGFFNLAIFWKGNSMGVVFLSNHT